LLWRWVLLARAEAENLYLDDLQERAGYLLSLTSLCTVLPFFGTEEDRELWKWRTGNGCGVGRFATGAFAWCSVELRGDGRRMCRVTLRLKRAGIAHVRRRACHTWTCCARCACQVCACSGVSRLNSGGLCGAGCSIWNDHSGAAKEPTILPRRRYLAVRALRAGYKGWKGKKEREKKENSTTISLAALLRLKLHRTHTAVLRSALHSWEGI